MNPILFLLAGFFLLAAPLFAAKIRVPQDQPTINAAIAIAHPYDVVVISKGRYPETVVVTVDHLTLVGKRDVMIDPMTSLLPAIRVSGASSVRIRRLAVRNIAGGILLDSTTFATVEDCLVESHHSAIHVSGDGNMVTACTVSNVFEATPAISVFGTAHIVQRNEIRRGWVRVEGVNHVLAGNSVTHPVFASGFLVFGDSNLLSDNVVKRAFYGGISVLGHANAMLGNRIASSGTGIDVLLGTKMCMVHENDVSRSSSDGIRVEGDDAVVSYNRVRKSGANDLAIGGENVLTFGNDYRIGKFY